MARQGQIGFAQCSAKKTAGLSGKLYDVLRASRHWPSLVSELQFTLLVVVRLASCQGQDRKLFRCDGTQVMPKFMPSLDWTGDRGIAKVEL